MEVEEGEMAREEGELTPLTFSELSNGMNVLLVQQFSDGHTEVYSGPITDLVEKNTAFNLRVGGKLFTVQKQSTTVKIYKMPQTGSRRSRKQKRSRRVKRRGVRLGTRRIRGL